MNDLHQAIADFRSAVDDYIKRQKVKAIIALIIDLIGPGFTPLKTNEQADTDSMNELTTWVDTISLSPDISTGP